MPLFTYKAKDSKGSIVEETIQAASREEAAENLKAEGLQVFSVKGIGEGLEKSVSIGGGRISVVEKANFCRFMATMLRAGLSFGEAVDVIRKETEGKRMKGVLSDIAFETRKGKSLSSVLAQHKKDFDSVFLTIIEAGEKSGTLEQAFNYLGTQLTASHELSSKIKGSLMYPAVIVTAMAGVGVMMVVFVLPKLSFAFTRMNIELPLTTQALLTVGDIVGGNVGISLLVVILGAIGIYFALTVKKTRAALLQLLAKVPVVKKMMMKIDVARFARVLSTLLRSGVPIIDALNVSADTLSQPNLKAQAKQFSEGISKGESLSEVLVKGKKAFPLIMIQTIKAGEKTGSMEDILQEMAEFYESEVEVNLKALTSLLEPVLMLFIGVAVGAMVVMIVAPIYSVVGSLQSTAGGGP